MVGIPERCSGALEVVGPNEFKAVIDKGERFLLRFSGSAGVGMAPGQSPKNLG